jgi:hypothetical protein
MQFATQVAKGCVILLASFCLAIIIDDGYIPWQWTMHSIRKAGVIK